MASTGTRPSVALILPSLNGGGAERAALNLHRHCRLDTRLIVERIEGDLCQEPMAADAIGLDLMPDSPRVIRVSALARTLRRLRPRVIVPVLSPLSGALAARMAGARTVFWLQNPPYFIPGARADRLSPPARVGLRTLAGLADAIAGATPGLCREWERAGVHSRKLTVLPNGLELPSAPLLRAPVESSRTLRLLTMGRLADQKRHDVLIRALADIRRDRPAELTILGRGEREAQLRALAQALGVSDHVHFGGFLADPSTQLRQAHVFVLASDYEGFGNVIVEALASGLPVVCTDVPHGPRFIAGGCSAIALVPRDDPGSLARAVVEIVKGSGPELANEAHRCASAFSIAVVRDHFEAIIQSVFRGEGPSPWRDPRGPPGH